MKKIRKRAQNGTESIKSNKNVSNANKKKLKRQFKEIAKKTNSFCSLTQVIWKIVRMHTGSIQRRLMLIISSLYEAHVTGYNFDCSHYKSCRKWAEQIHSTVVPKNWFCSVSPCNIYIHSVRATTTTISRNGQKKIWYFCTTQTAHSN